MRADEDALADAVHWYIKLTSEDVTDAEKQAWEVWLNQSAAHHQAWERILQKLSLFESLPADIGVTVLARASSKVNTHRRDALKFLGLMAVVAVPAAYLYKEALLGSNDYDYSTRVGERKTVTLPDGTVLVLNTNTAVTMAASSQARTLTLHRGEILVQTGHAGVDGRPLMVNTVFGNILPLGTQFNVRHFDHLTRITLFEGRLQLTAKEGAQLVMKPNQEVDMFATHIHLHSENSLLSAAWQNGYLQADNLALQSLIEELARYRSGFLLCHPDVREMKVSGAYSVDDIDASLNSLTQTFPLKIQQITRFLTLVLPV